jgi:hypothetical protein
MRQLVTCNGCGGLKRLDSARCPHCERPAPKRWLWSGLAVLGLGALAACGSSMMSAVLYGPVGLPDSGDSGNYTPADAYGVVPLMDAGVDGGADAGDGGD